MQRCQAQAPHRAKPWQGCACASPCLCTGTGPAVEGDIILPLPLLVRSSYSPRCLSGEPLPVCILLPFALFGTFNPLGHISELKNFRADIAF